MRLCRILMLLAVAAVLTAACTSGPKSAPPRGQSAPPSASQAAPQPATSVAAAGGSCSSAPPVTPLPAWARGGFHPPDVSMPHVLGARGDIVAILWARRNALRAPPLADRANKILWVSKLQQRPMSPLMIRATLAGTSRTVYREVSGGPGPSYVNLPAAGCWVLDLSWSGHTDRLELRYAAS